MPLQRSQPIAVEMSLTASLRSAYRHNWREAEKRKVQGIAYNGLGKSNRSADTPFENLLHVLHFFPKWRPEGRLFLRNIRSTIYSVLSNREMHHWPLLISSYDTALIHTASLFVRTFGEDCTK